MTIFKFFRSGHAASLAVLVALAASATTSGAQTTALSTVPTSTVATYICRPAETGETATATMTAGATKLECRSFAVAMRRGDGTLKTIGSLTVRPQPGPDLSHALTAQQIQDACAAWLYKVMNIEPATLHTP